MHQCRRLSYIYAATHAHNLMLEQCGDTNKEVKLQRSFTNFNPTRNQMKNCFLMRTQINNLSINTPEEDTCLGLTCINSNQQWQEL